LAQINTHYLFTEHIFQHMHYSPGKSESALVTCCYSTYYFV